MILSKMILEGDAKKRAAAQELIKTELGITFVKDTFQRLLAQELNLMRVTAPLFVKAGTGINDDLNGVERPVSFSVRADGATQAVIVHSLAKWKRMTLARYNIPVGAGIYADMNAIRADEDLDAIHSLYVDQWDWERVIRAEDRTIDFLKTIVRSIYSVVYKVAQAVAHEFNEQPIDLPAEITFIHAQELEDRYPTFSPKERENAACKQHGAVFIIGIGGVLLSGKPHDGRSCDYDDWSTPTGDGFCGLNGDILVWNAALQSAFELSSMGIRVDKVALERQLALHGQQVRASLLFHRMLLAGELPLSIGGGIGQSRLCMLYLKKTHIGQVQASIWPEAMVKDLHDKGILLL